MAGPCSTAGERVAARGHQSLLRRGTTNRSGEPRLPPRRRLDGGSGDHLPRHGRAGLSETSRRPWRPTWRCAEVQCPDGDSRTLLGPGSDGIGPRSRDTGHDRTAFRGRGPGADQELPRTTRTTTIPMTARSSFATVNNLLTRNI